MTRIPKVLPLAVVLAMGVALQVWAQSPKPATNEVELCDFKVLPVLADANATFSMIFALEIGEEGVPTNIRRVEGHFLDERSFIECLKKWRLAAPRGQKVLVEFDWVHGKGWVRVTITSSTLALTMRIAPGACVATER